MESCGFEKTIDGKIPVVKRLSDTINSAWSHCESVLKAFSQLAIRGRLVCKKKSDCIEINEKITTRLLRLTGRCRRHLQRLDSHPRISRCGLLCSSVAEKQHDRHGPRWRCWNRQTRGFMTPLTSRWLVEFLKAVCEGRKLKVHKRTSLRAETLTTKAKQRLQFNTRHTRICPKLISI